MGHRNPDTNRGLDLQISDIGSEPPRHHAGDRISCPDKIAPYWLADWADSGRAVSSSVMNEATRASQFSYGPIQLGLNSRESTH